MREWDDVVEAKWGEKTYYKIVEALSLAELEDMVNELHEHGYNSMGLIFTFKAFQRPMTFSQGVVLDG